jgi:hypothetical protein
MPTSVCEAKAKNSERQECTNQSLREDKVIRRRNHQEGKKPRGARPLFLSNPQKWKRTDYEKGKTLEEATRTKIRKTGPKRVKSHEGKRARKGIQSFL